MTTIRTSLADGTKITAPKTVAITEGMLDGMENRLWETVEQYLALFNIRLEEKDTGPDWATVKAMQDALLAQLEEAGIRFEA